MPVCQGGEAVSQSFLVTVVDRLTLEPSQVPHLTLVMSPTERGLIKTPDPLVTSTSPAPGCRLQRQENSKMGPLQPSQAGPRGSREGRGVEWPWKVLRMHSHSPATGWHRALYTQQDRAPDCWMETSSCQF